MGGVWRPWLGPGCNNLKRLCDANLFASRASAPMLPRSAGERAHPRQPVESSQTT